MRREPLLRREAITSRHVPQESSPAWAEWFTPGRFSIFLALLIVATFASVLFGGQTFFLRDFGYFSYPLAHYHRECFWRGELPLWNPLNSCGTPFLAQWNTLTLYPGSLIYLLLPLPWSLNFFCLLHLFLGGLGMYFLAQRWTNHRLAAAVAGLLFTFNGFTLNCLMWSNNIAALGLMPWVVLLAQRGWQQGGRAALIAALVGATQMLSGAPEMILLTWVMVGGIFLCDLMIKEVAPGRVLLRFGGVLLLVAGLASAQLLPFLELLRASERSTSYDSAYWPIPLWGWANLFVPLFRMMRTPVGSYFQYDQEWVASYYTGVCGLLLAMVGLLKARHARVWLLGSLALFSLMLAFGDNGFLYPALRKLAPQLAFMRFPVKFLIIFNFVLPLLAAFALARFGQCPRLPRTFFIVAGVMLATIAGIVVYARSHPVPYENWNVTLQNGLERAALVAVLVALIYWLKRAKQLHVQAAAALLICIVIFLDGLTHSPKTNPVIPSGALQPGMVELKDSGMAGGRTLLSRAAYREVYSKMLSNPVDDFLLHRQALMANCNLIDGLSAADGFFSLNLLQPRQVLTKFSVETTNFPTAPLLDFLSVGYINSPYSVFDWTNRSTALPIATIGQRPIFADGRTTVNAMMDPSFKPAETVYLPKDAEALVSASSATEARITSQQLNAHRMNFEVAAKADTLLVVAQSFYRAWVPSVDGKPVPLLRANHGFQAVAVPSGTHSVTLEYRDGTFRKGVILTVCSFMAVVVLWFAAFRRRALATSSVT